MGWFKQMMGMEAPATKPQPVPEGPLGLARGKGVEFDPSLKLLLDGQSAVLIPGPQQVWSQGKLDLGQGVWLSRYYMDQDEFWLQVHSTGAVNGQVESLILFNYVESIGVASDDELKRLAGPASPIGLPSHERDGVVYAREWGTEVGQAELVGLFERVTNPQESYSVQHRSMLYSRDTGLTDRREFLLFSVELGEDGGVSLSTSLGISLYPTDLKVI